MFRHSKILQVTCVATCVSLAPWAHAFGGDHQTLAAPQPTRIRDAVRQVSFEAAAPQDGGGQSVATTTESKLLLGLATGALMVGGLSMMAYGSTATCKGKDGASTSGCDRTVLVGTLAFSSGAAMALLWALSR